MSLVQVSLSKLPVPGRQAHVSDLVAKRWTRYSKLPYTSTKPSRSVRDVEEP
jgi:hypothetical protein